MDSSIQLKVQGLKNPNKRIHVFKILKKKLQYLFYSRYTLYSRRGKPNTNTIGIQSFFKYLQI